MDPDPHEGSQMSHLHAGNSTLYGPKRQVSFYRSTRPQAPVRHSGDPVLAELVECSVCRGVFLPDTPEAKKAHRALHEAEKVAAEAVVVVGNKAGFLYLPLACSKLQGCHENRYQFTTVCDECGEDVCPCPVCVEQHKVECEFFALASRLVEADRDEDADDLVNAILAVRAGTLSLDALVLDAGDLEASLED